MGGVMWQKFLRILSLYIKDVVNWAMYDRVGWGDTLIGSLWV